MMAAIRARRSDAAAIAEKHANAYILAYDSDSDREEDDTISSSVNGVTPSPDFELGASSVTPTHSRLSAEDSETSASAAHATTMATTPASAGRTRSGSPATRPAFLRQLNTTDLAALAAEKLLAVNATAETQRERAAALAQLARFHGAYRALCRGAPFSVWVRYEDEAESVVRDTADFFRYELEELVAARRARRHNCEMGGNAGKWKSGASEALRHNVVISESLGRRLIGCRATLPCLANPGNRSVCQLRGEWDAADAESAEEAEALARLPQGDRALIRLLSLEDGGVSGGANSQAVPSSLVVDPSTTGTAFCYSPLGSAIFADTLSPLAIYTEDATRCASDGSVSVNIVPGKRARSSHDGIGAKDGTRRMATSRRLEFDEPTPATAAPVVSLSTAAVEQRNHRIMQEWLRSSQDAFLIPY